MGNVFNNEISYLLLKDELNITYPDGSVWIIKKSDFVFDKVLKAISNNESSSYFKEIQNNAFAHENKDGLSVSEGKVYFDGVRLPGKSLPDYVLSLNGLGLPLTGVSNFLKLLQKNYSYNVRHRLFDYLKHHKISLNTNGYFYAFICVENQLKPGDVFSLNRAEINDNALNSEKSPSDVASLEVISGNKRTALSHIYLCAVSPADVVMVPYVFSQNKLRACSFEIISEFQSEIPVSTGALALNNEVSFVVDVLPIESIAEFSYSVKSMHSKISDAVNSFNDLCEKDGLYYEVRICSINTGLVVENRILSSVDIDLREQAARTQLPLELPLDNCDTGGQRFIVLDLDTNSVLGENLNQEDSLQFALEQRNKFGIKVKVINTATNEVCVSLT